MLKEISENEIKVLFESDDIFSLIKDKTKNRFLEKIKTQKIDLSIIDDERVGSDFIKYLIKNKELNLVKHIESLMNYLKVIAAFNNRRNITQSDLLLLNEIRMDELGFSNWEDVVTKSVNETMFRELKIYLNQNVEFKDYLTEAFENKKVTKEDVENSIKLIGWLDNKIVELESSRNEILSGPQLINVFNQEEINKFYNDSIDSMLKMMKFQRLAFSLVL